jgi:hypothetical protein
MLRGPLALTAALLALCPAAAGAATVSTDRSCYRDSSYARISGTGFTPNKDILIRWNGNATGRALTDSSGNFDTMAVTPSQDQGGTRDFTVSAGSGSEVATAPEPVKVIGTYVRLFPSRVTRRTNLELDAFGFYPGALYAHVRGPRRTRRNIRLGLPEGDCGTLSRRWRPFRAGDPAGRYNVYFDTNRRFEGTPRDPMVDEFPQDRVTLRLP